MKPHTFFEFLQERHAESYHGTDDNMPDAFESWLGDLQIDNWVILGDEFGERFMRCKKSVEGNAVCGVKLDCHLHDWRANN
jgi:hypothetical protein